MHLSMVFCLFSALRSGVFGAVKTSAGSKQTLRTRDTTKTWNRRQSFRGL